MSLILEALRKSEAERRLGSAPDVLAAMPVLRTQRPRRSAAAVTIGVLVLGLAAGIGWWWTRPASVPFPSPARPERVATRPDAAPHRGAADPAPLPAVILLPSTAPRAATTVAAPAVPAAAGVARTAQVGSDSAAPTDLPPPPALPPPAAPSMAVPPAAIEPPAVAPAAPAQPDLPTIADLAPAERAALPALKITMHVYADDPSRRFMIIDGQRVGEGARIADGVVLVHVRRDGAEIDARGRRLLLPKP